MRRTVKTEKKPIKLWLDGMEEGAMNQARNLANLPFVFRHVAIMPGSQGSPSYIVRGLGNPESFESCSHGAGRKMGRKEATRRLDLATEQKRLDVQGIIHAVRSKNDLEEAAGAYKEIAQVMEDQLDLVEMVVELRPLAVIKG